MLTASMSEWPRITSTASLSLFTKLSMPSSSPVSEKSLAICTATDGFRLEGLSTYTFPQTMDTE